MNTLRQVKVGQTCIVKRVHGEGALRRRIMDMGIMLEKLHRSETRLKSL